MIHCFPNTAIEATNNVMDKQTKRMDWALAAPAGAFETGASG